MRGEYLLWDIVMISFPKTLWLTLMMLLPSVAFASFVYPVAGHNFHEKITEYSYLPKPLESKLTSNELLALPKASWQQHHKLTDIPHLLKGENWLYFKIRNSDSVAKAVFLEIKNSRYLIDAKIVVRRNASHQKHSPKANDNNRRVEKLLLPANTTVDLYLLLNVQTDVYLPIELLSEQIYIQSNDQQAFYKGIALGGYIFLALGMLLLFLASGRKSILYLSGYFLTRTLLLSVLLGRERWSFFERFSWWNELEIPILTSLSSLCLLWFCIELFSLKRKFIGLRQKVKITTVLLFAYILVSLWLEPNSHFMLSLLLHNLMTLLLVIIGWQLMKKHIPLATLFTIIMFIQFTVSLLIDVGIVWHNLQLFNNSELLFSISFWLNGLLFIFLVSRLAYLQVHEKHVAQREALESAKQTEQAQAELLQLQQETQEQLEDRVQERTLELNIAFQELETLNKQLAQKSTTDDLTGLYNRRFYDQKMQAEFRRSRRNLTPLSLLIIDVDHFKKVNDSYGHLAGDECLVWLAQRMKTALRRSADLSFRYGGEEFCIILPETDSLGAKLIAEQLRQQVQQEAVPHQGKDIKLTISCGVTTYQQQANVQVEDIFACADKALYRAKDNGRNQVQIENLLNPQE